MVEQNGEYYLDYPPSVVFGYLRQAEHVSTLAPSLDDSVAVDEAENGGPIIRAEYSVGSGIAEGSTHLIPQVFEPNERIRYAIDDDIRGYIDWSFEPEGEGTRFVYDAEYEVTIPVPDFFMKTIGQHISQRELDVMIENLREELANVAESDASRGR